MMTMIAGMTAMARMVSSLLKPWTVSTRTEKIDQYDAIAECGSEADFNGDDGPGQHEDTAGDVGNGLTAEFDDFNDFDMISLESHNRNRFSIMLFLSFLYADT